MSFCICTLNGYLCRLMMHLLQYIEKILLVVQLKLKLNSLLITYFSLVLYITIYFFHSCYCVSLKSRLLTEENLYNMYVHMLKYPYE